MLDMNNCLMVVRPERYLGNRIYHEETIPVLLRRVKLKKHTLQSHSPGVCTPLRHLQTSKICHRCHPIWIYRRRLLQGQNPLHNHHRINAVVSWILNMIIIMIWECRPWAYISSIEKVYLILIVHKYTSTVCKMTTNIRVCNDIAVVKQRLLVVYLCIRSGIISR